MILRHAYACRHAAEGADVDISLPAIFLFIDTSLRLRLYYSAIVLMPDARPHAMLRQMFRCLFSLLIITITFEDIVTPPPLLSPSVTFFARFADGCRCCRFLRFQRVTVLSLLRCRDAVAMIIA